jgi:hypothetical protein
LRLGSAMEESRPRVERVHVTAGDVPAPGLMILLDEIPWRCAGPFRFGEVYAGPPDPVGGSAVAGSQVGGWVGAAW